MGDVWPTETRQSRAGGPPVPSDLWPPAPYIVIVTGNLLSDTTLRHTRFMRNASI